MNDPEISEVGKADQSERGGFLTRAEQQSFQEFTENYYAVRAINELDPFLAGQPDAPIPYTLVPTRVGEDGSVGYQKQLPDLD